MAGQLACSGCAASAGALSAELVDSRLENAIVIRMILARS